MDDVSAETAPDEPGEPRQTTAAKICAATFWTSSVSLAGLLALSVWLFSGSNSYVLTAVLFGCQWVLPLLIPTTIDRLCRGRSPRVIGVASEIATAVIYALLAFCVTKAFLPGIFALVLLRGYTDAVSKTAASLAMELDGENSAEADGGFGQLDIWRLVGTSASGILFAIAGATTSPQELLLVGAAVHLVSTAIYATVASPAPTPAVTGPRHAVDARIADVLREEPVATLLLAQLAVITLFQGLHNALRVAYPVQVLHQGTQGIGTVSAVSTAAMLGGGWLVTRKAVRAKLGTTWPWAFVVAGSLLAAVATSLTMPIPSYVGYFLFFLLIEAGFVHFNRQFAASIAPANVSAMLSLRTSVLCGSALAGLGMTAMGIAFTTIEFSTYVVAYVVIFGTLCAYGQYRAHQLAEEKVTTRL